MTGNELQQEVAIAVLALLSDGAIHSGEELGALLGVSRTSIWKTLKKVEQLGVTITPVKGRGYQIEGGLDLLDASEITAHLGPDIELQISVLNQVDSTNALLMRDSSPVAKVCLAESQTAGRGRRGKPWVSPFAQNIYLSIGWGFSAGVTALEGLSLAIGVAMIRALNAFGVTGLRLKWPNDLLYKNKKLGGILIEMSGDPAGECSVVVGLGLNLSMSADKASTIDQPWVNLHSIFTEQSLPTIPRNELVAGVLRELLGVLATYEQIGFTAYKAEWEAAAAHLHQIVIVHAGSHTDTGVMLGVDKGGALRVSIDGQERLFHGGEVSLRRANDS